MQTKKEVPTAPAKPKAKDPREATEDRIRAVAATISPAELEVCQEIVMKAKSGSKSSATYTLTPAMNAWLFGNCNGFNRSWHDVGPKSATEYARRMALGLWQWNGEGLGFYTTGTMSDGQHRTSGAALAGYTLETVIVFGISPKAAATIDDGLARHASDHAAMIGLKETKRKQSIIKTAGAYFAKVGPEPIEFPSLRSESETSDAIAKHDVMLSTALQIAIESERSVASPLLSINEAGKIAFVLLFGGWPVEKIAHALRRVQSGDVPDSEGGGTNVLYVANEIIASKTKGKTLAQVKQVALVILAMVKLESGISSMRRGHLKAEVDRVITDPTFHPANVQVAA